MTHQTNQPVNSRESNQTSTASGGPPVQTALKAGKVTFADIGYLRAGQNDYDASSGGAHAGITLYEA